MPADVGLLVEAWRALRHRYRYGKSWLVHVSKLDERGFQTNDSREIVVESKHAAVLAIRDISRLLETSGSAGLDAKLKAGEYRLAVAE